MVAAVSASMGLVCRLRFFMLAKHACNPGFQVPDSLEKCIKVFDRFLSRLEKGVSVLIPDCEKHFSCIVVSVPKPMNVIVTPLPYMIEL
jgi:hypothetical protein